ncbi:MAG: rhodanese-like domain-containing protein [Vulcanimicrobiota bacterium]
MSYHVCTFYALAPLDEAAISEILERLRAWEPGEPALNGMVLVAPDGVNATLAGSAESLRAIENWLAGRLPLSTIKRSRSPIAPFRRWKVVRRRETVTSGEVGQQGAAAQHLSPARWHEMLQQPDVFVIDVRNDYEIRLGTFRGAVDPKTSTFTRFADYVAGLDLPKDKPILTFCTGGIRCEKAAPYLAAQGYSQVYQLDGGILNYLEQFPHGLFEGECFVFDERVALDQNLEPTRRYRRCPQCGQPGTEPCPDCGRS